MHLSERRRATTSSPRLLLALSPAPYSACSAHAARARTQRPAPLALACVSVLGLNVVLRWSGQAAALDPPSHTSISFMFDTF